MPTFPEAVDSTMMAAMGSCWHKFFREHIEGWKPRAPSVHLHAGAAFAAGLEAARLAFYREGLSSEESEAEGLEALMRAYGDFEAPPGSAKTLDRMAGALTFYFDNYPLGADGCTPITLPGGKLGIEVSFAEPLEVLHPETGNPILYCGRLDLAANFAGGIFVEDDKTASALGALWSKQWDLRSQFTGYTWGLWKAANVKPSGVLVRGVSILKTKYETQQAITYRPDWMLDEWYSKTCDLLEEAKRRWAAGYWRKNLDHACTEYGGCSFVRPCSSPDATPWLEQSFERRFWNPITREETRP